MVSALPAEHPRVIGPANVVLPLVNATPIISASPTRVVENQQVVTDKDNSLIHFTWATGID